MKSNFSLDQIAGYIQQASATKLRNPFRDDALIRASKYLVQAIQEDSIDEQTLIAGNDALSFFAIDITAEDINLLISTLKNQLLLVAFA